MYLQLPSISVRISVKTQQSCQRAHKLEGGKKHLETTFGKKQTKIMYSSTSSDNSFSYVIMTIKNVFKRYVPLSNVTSCQALVKLDITRHASSRREKGGEGKKSVDSQKHHFVDSMASIIENLLQTTEVTVNQAIVPCVT